MRTDSHIGSIDRFASVCEGETLIVGSIHVKEVETITSEESVAISVVAHPNGPTVTIQGLPDTVSQLDAIPHSLYQISFPDIPLRPGVAACTATGKAITSVGSFAATIDWLVDDWLSRPVPSPERYTY
jgi:hypothetical protein